jgi:hypothetical protein
LLLQRQWMLQLQLRVIPLLCVLWALLLLLKSAPPW